MNLIVHSTHQQSRIASLTCDATQITERCLCKTYLIKAEVHVDEESLHLNAEGQWNSPQTKMWQIWWWYNVCSLLLIKWPSQCQLIVFLPLSPCKQCISATWNPAIWILPEQTGNPSHTAPFSGLHLQDTWSGALSCHPHLFQSPSLEPSSACRASREDTVTDSHSHSDSHSPSCVLITQQSLLGKSSL